MNQELMTLDFWQDTIIYEDKALPIGTLACDALNVSADTLAKMNEQCQKINLLLGMLNAGQDASALFPMAREAALTMLEILSKTLVISFRNEDWVVAEAFGTMFLGGDMAVYDTLELVDLKKEIMGVIHAVPNVEYQMLLEKRYLCFITWEQIAVDLNYSIQHIHRMHSAALKEIVVPQMDES